MGYCCEVDDAGVLRTMHAAVSLAIAAEGSSKIVVHHPALVSAYLRGGHPVTSLPAPCCDVVDNSSEAGIQSKDRLWQLWCCVCVQTPSSSQLSGSKHDMHACSNNLTCAVVVKMAVCCVRCAPRMPPPLPPHIHRTHIYICALSLIPLLHSGVDDCANHWLQCREGAAAECRHKQQ